MKVKGTTRLEVDINPLDVLTNLMEKIVPNSYWIKEEDGKFNVYYDDNKMDNFYKTISEEDYNQVIRLTKSIDYYIKNNIS